jgi:hypothetical protein
MSKTEAYLDGDTLKPCDASVRPDSGDIMIDQFHESGRRWREIVRRYREKCQKLFDKLEERQAELEVVNKRFTAPIVCICGSTKFKQSWIAENVRLTSEGNIVLAVALWGYHERIFPDAETKAKLDNLHKRKIDLCDWVWVLDINGYIGESTRSEINYAESLHKPIRYLSKKFPEYKEPKDLLQSELEAARKENEMIQKSRRKLSNAMHAAFNGEQWPDMEGILFTERTVIERAISYKILLDAERERERKANR